MIFRTFDKPAVLYRDGEEIECPNWLLECDKCGERVLYSAVPAVDPRKNGPGTMECSQCGAEIETPPVPEEYVRKRRSSFWRRDHGVNPQPN